MCSNVNNDCEWRTVPFKKNRRFAVNTSLVTSAVDDSGTTNVRHLETRLKRVVAELQHSELCRACLNLLDPALKGVEEILCYGLGSPSSSSASVHQLALLFLFRDGRRCSVYDPVFNQSDLLLFEREYDVITPPLPGLTCFCFAGLNIDVIAEDERCCRKLDAKTLVYMVHCDMWMYNNLLWANWSPETLCKVALVGNSFNLMLERFPARHMKALYNYIYLSGKWNLFEETLLPSWGERDSVFNDTAVMTFPPRNVQREFTRPETAPCYDDVVM